MTAKSELTVASVQMTSDEYDKEKNLALMESFVKRAAAQGADVISFPEICLTGYNWILYADDEATLLQHAERVPDGPSTQRVLGMAKANHIAVLYGLLEKDHENKLWNTFVACRPDGTTHAYRKIHAFENSLMQQGAEYPIFDLYGWKCGVLICYDNNLLENTLCYAVNGCELLFSPHQTGGFDIEVAGMGRIDVALWENRHANPSALRAEFQGPKGREWLTKWYPCRAYDSGMFHIFSNGVGLDTDEIRTGNAMIVDPNGIILAESRSIESDMTLATLQRSALENTIGRFHMKTRNPDLYGALRVMPENHLDTRSARNQMTCHSEIR